MPLTVAALLFDDTEWQDDLIRRALAVDTFHDDQTIKVSKSGRGIWGVSSSASNYWRLVTTDGGNRINADPYRYIDGGKTPGTSYQVCCNLGNNLAWGYVLNKWPEFRRVWANEHFYDYIERIALDGVMAQPDPCAPVPGVCENNAKCSTAKPCASGSCQLDTISSPSYGVTWGDKDGSCVPDTDMSDGIGRFPQRHGVKVSPGYADKWINELFATHFVRGLLQLLSYVILSSLPDTY